MQIYYWNEIMLCCLEQKIIPKGVMENWKNPLYDMGEGYNLNYEMAIWIIFLKKFCEEEIIK